MAGLAFDPVTAGLSAASSLGQLLIGENSLFSGKKRLASRELKNNFDAGQAAGIGSKYYDYLKAKETRGNLGLDAQSIALAQQEQGRGMNTAISALGGRRSALSGISGLASGASDFALKLGVQNEMAQKENRNASNDATLMIAGQEQQNELRKREDAANYWGAQRQESDQSITSALSGIGAGIGAGIQAGQFNSSNKINPTKILPTLGTSLSSLAGKAPYSGLDPQNYGGLQSANTFRNSAQNALSNYLLRKSPY